MVISGREKFFFGGLEGRAILESTIDQTTRRWCCQMSFARIRQELRHLLQQVRTSNLLELILAISTNISAAAAA